MGNNKLLIFLSAILIIVICACIGCTIYVKKNQSDKGKRNLNTLHAIDTSNSQKNNQQKEEKINYVEEINVYNAAEYMDESTIKDFEKQFKIKVNYSEFESNEDMYTEIIKSPKKYDVLIPSDYMIDRLIKENRVEKINKANVPNISNIATEYLNPDYDKQNEYVVPYMTGTVGILYNKKLVKEEVNSFFR